jgi:signal transduction histidine kinase
LLQLLIKQLHIILVHILSASHSVPPDFAKNRAVRFLEWFVDSSALTPHGFCLFWQPGLLWVDAISDGVTMLAYFSIPLALLWFVRRRSDLPHRWIALLFIGFIVACGVTHGFSILTLWVPAYWPDAMAKVVTASLSIFTAITLWQLVPTLLTLPSPTAMASLNEALRASLEDQRKVMIQLQRSNDDLEQYAYVASHDLKAPLRAIDSLVGWIEEDMAATLRPDTRANMDLLKGRVRRLERLLDDLLAFAHAGRGDSAIAPVDTDALVKEMSGLVFLPEGFVIESGAAMPTLMTARAPLTQVLQNLISNAIKHHEHPANGHVWIETLPADGGVELIVTDDGPGIPERFRDRVFGMFQTLRPRDEVEGSGMGLAIVKKLVERQGGRIWLSEGRAGRGLSVHFIWMDAKNDIEGGYAA